MMQISKVRANDDNKNSSEVLDNIKESPSIVRGESCRHRCIIMLKSLHPL